jgi:hypothetical protein
MTLEVIQVIALALVFINVVWRAVMIWRTQRDGTLEDGATPRDTPASAPGSSRDLP